MSHQVEKKSIKRVLDTSLNMTVEGILRVHKFATVAATIAALRWEMYRLKMSLAIGFVAALFAAYYTLDRLKREDFKKVSILKLVT